MQEPTHSHGHTLDLVLSHGFQISDIEISKTCFSDHRLVLFSSHFPDPVVATPSVTRLNRYFSTQSCERFAASYAITDPPVPELSSPVQDVNRLFNFFNQKCLSTLNLIAPLKPKRIVTNSQQWLNDSTRLLRKTCRSPNIYRSLLVTVYSDLRPSSLLLILCSVSLSTFFLMLPYHRVNNSVIFLMRKLFN